MSDAPRARLLQALPQATGPAHPPSRRRIGVIRPRDDWRLIIVILSFVLVYAAVGVRMGMMALDELAEPRLARDGAGATPVRGEISDRHGTLLASNLPAFSLYAHPREIKDPAAVAQDLAGIFPDLDAATLTATLSRDSGFVWVKRPITPAQRQKVLDLGFPGLQFGVRTMRVYPAGRTVAHIVGGVRAENEDVRYTELAGAGGVEGFFDERLRDPARIGTPLALSLDLSVQNALRDVLAAGVRQFEAKGAAGILMDVRTGEILALVSLPDFDPNEAPAAFQGPAELNPRFNRAVQGRYELGSTFKVLTAAFALESGAVRPDTLVETGSALSFGRFRIRDMHRMPPEMTVTDIIVRSSNVGVARMALQIGTPRFKDYFQRLGLFEATTLELAEARKATPLLPPKWTDLSSMTISFGHGLAASPLHLAAAFATLANDGRRVRPTLLRGGSEPGEQVVSPKTARQVMQIIRDVVKRGTGRRANLPGYEVGGKTGTADKVRPEGGYYTDRVIASFASVFPTTDPKYALVISLDEPVDRSGPRAVREASRTAVPVAVAAIERVAPLLGLRPLPEVPTGVVTAVTASAQ